MSFVFSVSVMFLCLLVQTTDVIRRTGGVEGRRRVSEGGSRIAARCSSQPQVLHGAASGDVRLTQLTSGQPVFELGNSRILFSLPEGFILVVNVQLCLNDADYCKHIEV